MVLGSVPCDGIIDRHAVDGGPVENASPRCQTTSVAKEMIASRNFTAEQDIAAVTVTADHVHYVCVL